MASCLHSSFPLRPPMRIVLADQRSSARSALRMLVRAQEDLDLVAEAANAEELFAAVADSSPDLAVFDFDDFDLSATNVLAKLRKILPSMAIVGMSVHAENRQVACSAGANSFVYKGDPPECLLNAVRGCKKPK